MAKLVALALKDLRVLTADKGNVFWVFGFPLLFALLFGAVYAGVGKGPSGMKLAVVDEDNSEFSQLYVKHLESEEALKVTRVEREQALTQVRKGWIAAAVVIRPGFGDGFSGFFDANDPKLQIASDPGQKMQGRLPGGSAGQGPVRGHGPAVPRPQVDARPDGYLAGRDQASQRPAGSGRQRVPPLLRLDGQVSDGRERPDLPRRAGQRRSQRGQAGRATGIRRPAHAVSNHLPAGHSVGDSGLRRDVRDLDCPRADHRHVPAAAGRPDLAGGHPGRQGTGVFPDVLPW